MSFFFSVCVFEQDKRNLGPLQKSNSHFFEKKLIRWKKMRWPYFLNTNFEDYFHFAQVYLMVLYDFSFGRRKWKIVCFGAVKGEDRPILAIFFHYLNIQDLEFSRFFFFLLRFRIGRFLPSCLFHIICRSSLDNSRFRCCITI